MDKTVNIMIEEAKNNIVNATLQAINDNPIPASVLKLVIAEMAQNIISAAQGQIESEIQKYAKQEQEAKKDGTEQ